MRRHRIKQRKQPSCQGGQRQPRFGWSIGRCALLHNPQYAGVSSSHSGHCIRIVAPRAGRTTILASRNGVSKLAMSRQPWATDNLVLWWHRHLGDVFENHVNVVADFLRSNPDMLARLQAAYDNTTNTSYGYVMNVLQEEIWDRASAGDLLGMDMSPIQLLVEGLRLNQGNIPSQVKDLLVKGTFSAYYMSVYRVALEMIRYRQTFAERIRQMGQRASAPVAGGGSRRVPLSPRSQRYLSGRLVARPASGTSAGTGARRDSPGARAAQAAMARFSSAVGPRRPRVVKYTRNEGSGVASSTRVVGVPTQSPSATRARQESESPPDQPPRSRNRINHLLEELDALNRMMMRRGLNPDQQERRDILEAMIESHFQAPNNDTSCRYVV